MENVSAGLQRGSRAFSVRVNEFLQFKIKISSELIGFSVKNFVWKATAMLVDVGWYFSTTIERIVLSKLRV